MMALKLKFFEAMAHLLLPSLKAVAKR